MTKTTDTNKNDPFNFFGLPTASAKTTLFEKIAEMDQLAVELDRLAKLPKTLRDDWIQQHETKLLDFMDQLVDASDVAIDRMNGDAQEVELSVEYVTKLRQVANQAKSLLDSDLSHAN